MRAPSVGQSCETQRVSLLWVFRIVGKGIPREVLSQTARSCRIARNALGRGRYVCRKWWNYNRVIIKR